MNHNVTEQTDVGVRIYLREIGQIPLLTPERECELAARVRKGDHEARSLMIRSNLRLVVKIAFEYANRGLPLLDLISEGNLGLLTAVERFDPSKRSRLSTYACWWIKQAIQRALANQGKTIRLPIHIVERLSKMRRVARQMSEELGREPTDDELADEVGLSRARVAQMRTAATHAASLDAPVGEDESVELGDVVCDAEAPTPFDQAGESSQHDVLNQILSGLTQREQRVIRARFGLDGADEKTLAELGAEIGLTRERVRQLQEMALRKLRRAMRKKEKFPPAVAWWAHANSALADLRCGVGSGIS